MRSFTVAERRARLARRHHLATEAPAADVGTLAGDLVGLHASDPATVYLSAWARIPDVTVADVEVALYDECTVVKHMAMRRTIWVVPSPRLAVVQAACSDAVARAERGRLAREVEGAGVADDGEAWLATAEAAVERVLEDLGSASGQQLSRALGELQGKIAYGEGKSWGGEIGVAGRVYTIMALEGRIRRGRPNGSWTSSQHRWALSPSGPTPAMDKGEAVAALVQQWLAAFGPATFDDLRWWTGLGVSTLRPALQAVGAVEVAVEVAGEASVEVAGDLGADAGAVPGLVLPDDLDPVEPVAPWAALLPSLDPTTMGWKHRHWYLGEHREAVFDRNGNAGPTVWWDGRVVGGWVQRRSGELAVELLEDVGAEARTAVDEVAARLQAWLGDVVVTPRFPTPLTSRLRG